MAPLYASRHSRSLGPSNPADFALPDGGADDLARRPVWHLEDGKELQRFVKHVFPKEEGFVPAKLEVNGRKNRRVALVLDEEGRRWRVYDLDHADDEDGSWVDESMEEAEGASDGDEAME